MATITTDTSTSIISSAAKHERDLLARLAESADEAKRTVEQARTEARQRMQTDENTLNDDVAKLRRDAEAARQAAFDATIQAAEAKLADVRDAANARVEQMADEVIALFVPNHSAGDR